MNDVFDAAATARALPWKALTSEIEALLQDGSVVVPPRLVQPLAGGGSLFVMPAADSRVAIAKLITFTPGNAAAARPAIQGDVVVFDAATGSRRALLDGPTVTARRTAAVSLLAAQKLAAAPQGPLLIVGAGAQGRTHLEAFAAGLPLREVRIASRTAASAQALVLHAQGLGLQARAVADADEALAECPLVVTCTPANGVVLGAEPREDAFIAAVGSFTPQMVELDPVLCRHIHGKGRIVLDSADARHEAGDLIQAGVETDGLATLQDVVIGKDATGPRGVLLFKSCGWAGWDLAAARCALQNS